MIGANTIQMDWIQLGPVGPALMKMASVWLRFLLNPLSVTV